MFVFFGLSMSGCAVVSRDTATERFADRYPDFTYCEIEAVKQKSQFGCGAACLEAVCGYWGRPCAQETILEEYPPLGRRSYPLIQLRNIARDRGLHAFILQMEKEPRVSLIEHLDKELIVGQGG